MSKHNRRQSEKSARRADGAPPAIDAYFDARGAGRPAKSMLDQVGRDASVLDDLARDREWIDEMKSPAPVPDQTHCILSRLGVDANQFNPRRHRFVLLSRRLSAAAVLVLAFVVGMWTRTSLPLAPTTRPVETAHRFERVIESLPIQMDPFGRVRGIMFDAGSSLAEHASQVDVAPQHVQHARPSEPDPRRHSPVRATVKEPAHPTLDPSDFKTEDIDVETLKAIYKDLGIV